MRPSSLTLSRKIWELPLPLLKDLFDVISDVDELILKQLCATGDEDGAREWKARMEHRAANRARFYAKKERSLLGPEEAFIEKSS